MIQDAKYTHNLGIKLFAIGSIALLSACAPPPEPPTIMSQLSPVELRSMQTRIFETGNQSDVFRALISTYQDLGYTLTSIEAESGTITANKLAVLTLTSTVTSINSEQASVRVIGIVKSIPQARQTYQIDSPLFFQQRVFEHLSKSLFLRALYEDGTEAKTDDIIQKENAKQN